MSGLFEFRRFAPLVLLLGMFLVGCSGGTDAFQRANFACGKTKPTKIIQHDGPFVNDDWLEVRCGDGTVRAIHNG